MTWVFFDYKTNRLKHIINMVEIENCWTQIMEVRKNVISGYSVVWIYTISLWNKQGIYGDEHVQCLYAGKEILIVIEGIECWF